MPIFDVMKSNAVDHYILRQEGDIRIMLEILNDLFCNQLMCEASLKYGLPFYAKKKQTICYLHKCKDESLDITFWNGKDYVKTFPQLEQRDRKRMASLNYKDPYDLDLELIETIANHVSNR